MADKKLAYSKPELTSHGALEVITLQGSSFNKTSQGLNPTNAPPSIVTS